MPPIASGRQHTPFLGHIEAWESEPLFEAQRAVRTLVDSPGWDVVCELIDAGRENAEARLKYGSVPASTAEYAKALGFVTGLESLEAAAEAVLLAAERRQKRLEAETGNETAPVGAEVS